MLSDPPCWICVLHECLVLGPLQSKAKSLAPVCSKTRCSLLELERRRNMLTRLMLSDPGFACCTNASRWARESAHQKKRPAMACDFIMSRSTRLRETYEDASKLFCCPSQIPAKQIAPVSNHFRSRPLPWF